MLEIVSHVNSIYNSISYVLLEHGTKECWIIDVGDFDVIKSLFDGYNLRGVLLTHVHYDHIYGLNELQADYPDVPIYTNEYGAKNLVSPIENLSSYHGEDFILSRTNGVKIIKEGNVILIGSYSLLVIDTPGHDYSCLSFCVDNNLFTGDSYIPGEKVFTKLQNGNKQLAEYSCQRLLRLGEKCFIRPGHSISFENCMNNYQADSIKKVIFDHLLQEKYVHE